MIRIFLSYVLPLILPTAGYIAWVWYCRKRAAKTGAEAPAITRGGLFWSIIVGVVLVGAGLAWVAITQGAGPGEGGYQSPRMEDGRIIPPQFK
ncbi:MAG: hypothetical protein VW268_01645 [Rhodospirillaceae bacterium]